MEETIGYESLLSSDEWDSLDFDDWSDDDIFDPEGSCSGNGPSAASPEHENHESEARAQRSPSGVTSDNGDGSAALSQLVTSEGSFPEHKVTCTERNCDDGLDPYVLECAVCEIIGSADDLAEAEAIARLHKSFVAELLGRWEVA